MLDGRGTTAEFPLHILFVTHGSVIESSDKACLGEGACGKRGIGIGGLGECGIGKVRADSAPDWEHILSTAIRYSCPDLSPRGEDGGGRVAIRGSRDC